MAAYAALVSLMNLMDKIQNHCRLSNSFDKKQIESLGEKVCFLLDFIESGPHGSCREAEVLERQIASAAYMAEDVIVSHVADEVHAGSISLLDLQRVIDDMDSVKGKVVNVKDERGVEDLQPIYPSPAPTSSTPLISTGKSKMVGFEDDLLQLMERLTGHQSTLQIIPIVGMGGIGKTTLARNVYENPLILQHFDLRAWVTISQNFSAIKVFSKLLSCLSIELDGGCEDELAQKLYQSLIRRRYLIVLDDLWDMKVWDKIKFFFPDNHNSSRIIVTTRLSNIAIYFGSSHLVMKFLDEDKSLKLFCEKAFPQEGCPTELEEIGKKIAKTCKGLPLLITVIGALLRNSSVTQKYWENISKDMNSILSLAEEEQSLDILSLSYSHLPAHLKPCFLYMGIFPEDADIGVLELINLWIAEGFVKPNKTQSLEEVAEGYLKDLFDRNLILVCKLRWNGKIKTCNIHDLLRDCCLKIAQKEKFVSVMRVCDILRGKENKCRIVMDGGLRDDNDDYQVLLQTLESTSLTRSLDGNKEAEVSFMFRLIRRLDMVGNDYSLQDIFNQVNLTYICTPYLYISGLSELSSSISLLWNLQILAFAECETIVAPPEIWEMSQLRHVEFEEIYIPEPPLSDREDDIILGNLQTLKRVLNLRLSEEVCKRICNIKKLYIEYEDLSGECEGSTHRYCLYNLDCLHKLETLFCRVRHEPNWNELMQNARFPTSLQKLTLEGWNLCWEDLTMIGSLPHLQVLKLKEKSVRGSEWNSVEGEFLRLKFLEISYCSDLVYWNADYSHFPVLEKLFLLGLDNLDEIPLGIGEIPTLCVIKMDCCSESAAISAVKILEEQESLGNEGLQVRVMFSEEEKLDKLREKLKEEFGSFISNNLQLECYLW